MTMREILFRGKHVRDGRWIVGFYNGVAPDLSTMQVKESHRIFSMQSLAYEVAPDTIGQYTGLTDKNGKKIFEGDILSAHFDFNNPDVESRAVVEWGNFRWVTYQPGYEPDDITDFDKGLWTVIGNIHDNPELMEGN